MESKANCVAYTGISLIILLPILLSSFDLAYHLRENKKMSKVESYIYITIVLVRFVAFGFLVNAMWRIRRVLSKDELKMPNNRMMLLHVVAFAGFLLANVPYAIEIGE